MKVYCVFENYWSYEEEIICYLYKIFSTEDKATKAIKELNEKSDNNTFYDIEAWEVE